jgi:hypothetical protein
MVLRSVSNSRTILDYLFSRDQIVSCSHKTNKGKVMLNIDPFWTTQYAFGITPEFAPKLYENLSKSELVMFKFPLNISES